MKNQNLPPKKNVPGVRGEQLILTLAKLDKSSLSELNLCELDRVVVNSDLSQRNPGRESFPIRTNSHFSRR